MALCDYILCCKCEIKLIYDGDRGNRIWWEERFGSEPEIKCPNCEKEALAQPEPEPVAWRVSYPNEPELGFWFSEGIAGQGCLNEPLYTHPKEWQGLTYQERTELWNESVKYSPSDVRMHDFAKDVEANLKQKNGYAEEKNK